jgi:hypothetical protein
VVLSAFFTVMLAIVGMVSNPHRKVSKKRI